MVGGRSLFVLSIRPFDAGLYEDEGDDDSDVLDEDGRARLKLKVENTIRWRKRVNEDGEEVKESNTRIVRWSDGRWVSLVDHVTGILSFFFPACRYIWVAKYLIFIVSPCKENIVTCL